MWWCSNLVMEYYILRLCCLLLCIRLIYLCLTLTSCILLVRAPLSNLRSRGVLSPPVHRPSPQKLWKKLSLANVVLWSFGSLNYAHPKNMCDFPLGFSLNSTSTPCSYRDLAPVVIYWIFFSMTRPMRISVGSLSVLLSTFTFVFV